jgi:hypothetical protein
MFVGHLAESYFFPGMPFLIETLEIMPAVLLD